jgi:S-(hydroxymethyl)glutathione dehydrogenase/alcohol dehydrogenase
LHSGPDARHLRAKKEVPMQMIKAAVCHEFGTPLVVEDVRLAAPGAGEVEIEISAVAICHSDITYADGGWGGAVPAVYGHEAAGRVRGVGDGVAGLAQGDPVVVTLIRACGQCPSCSTGRPTGCEMPQDGTEGPLTTQAGGKLHQAMACGAFAERVVVHHSQIARIPEGIDMAAASLLACGVITGVGAVVNAAGLRAGEDVVVIGAGGVGLNAIQGARIAGARRIVAVDMTEEKLNVAREFGATDGVLATGDTPWRAVKAILGRGADAVLVTVGVAGAYDSAPRYLAGGGRMIMVGMPHSGATSRYEAGNFAAMGQSMIGSKMGEAVIRRDIPWMVDLYGQGRLKLDELISGRWPLDRINDAIADTRSGAARRNVITFP